MPDNPQTAMQGERITTYVAGSGHAVTTATGEIADGAGQIAVTVGGEVAVDAAGGAMAGVVVRFGPGPLRWLFGEAATTHVYFGVRNGERVYVGITNDIARRQAEHGGWFVLERITQSPVTRGEARAIEQALINRNPGFENIRNSISPNHSWYGEAVEWGEAWLRGAGY